MDAVILGPRQDERREGKQATAQSTIGSADLAGTGIGQVGRFMMSMALGMFQRVPKSALLRQWKQQTKG